MEHTVIHDEKVNRFEVFESGQIAYLHMRKKTGCWIYSIPWFLHNWKEWE